jgi:hypothetical protein
VRAGPAAQAAQRRLARRAGRRARHAAARRRASVATAGVTRRNGGRIRRVGPGDMLATVPPGPQGSEQGLTAPSPLPKPPPERDGFCCLAR